MKDSDCLCRQKLNFTVHRVFSFVFFMPLNTYYRFMSVIVE
jgi:hypothetical protein